MYKEKKDMLQCPFCHKELIWKIKREEKDYYIEGEAECKGRYI